MGVRYSREAGGASTMSEAGSVSKRRVWLRKKEEECTVVATPRTANRKGHARNSIKCPRKRVVDNGQQVRSSSQTPLAVHDHNAEERSHV